jgi:Zn-dependent peptidase ImmA (M78 family)
MYDWIDECIVGLLEFHDDRNIYDLYETLNIDIVKLPKNNVLLQGKEAIYHRSLLGSEIVYLRDDLHFEYERFILAHELGHAILHIEIYEAAFNKDLINKGKLEKQAHYFAIKLLDITLDPIEHEGMTIEQIAGSLHVAEDSLEYALESQRV